MQPEHRSRSGSRPAPRAGSRSTGRPGSPRPTASRARPRPARRRQPSGRTGRRAGVRRRPARRRRGRRRTGCSASPRARPRPRPPPRATRARPMRRGAPEPRPRRQVHSTAGGLRYGADRVPPSPRVPASGRSRNVRSSRRRSAREGARGARRAQRPRRRLPGHVQGRPPRRGRTCRPTTRRDDVGQSCERANSPLFTIRRCDGFRQPCHLADQSAPPESQS